MNLFKIDLETVDAFVASLVDEVRQTAQKNNYDAMGTELFLLEYIKTTNIVSFVLGKGANDAPAIEQAIITLKLRSQSHSTAEELALSANAKSMISNARAWAKKNGREKLSIADLFWGMTTVEGCGARQVFKHLEIEASQVFNRFLDICGIAHEDGLPTTDAPKHRLFLIEVAHDEDAQIWIASNPESIQDIKVGFEAEHFDMAFFVVPLSMEVFKSIHGDLNINERDFLIFEEPHVTTQFQDALDIEYPQINRVYIAEQPRCPDIVKAMRRGSVLTYLSKNGDIGEIEPAAYNVSKHVMEAIILSLLKEAEQARLNKLGSQQSKEFWDGLYAKHTDKYVVLIEVPDNPEDMKFLAANESRHHLEAEVLKWMTGRQEWQRPYVSKLIQLRGGYQWL